LLLPWFGNPGKVFSEVARVLRKGGVFAFATLGPDSLQEISRAWSQVDNSVHINRFLDMHNLGDGLVNAGLRDPVLDVDRLSVSYESSDQLFSDLTATGARNALLHRAKGLTGKRQFATMVNALEDGPDEGKIVLSLELVYGHCWGAGPKTDPRNFKIDANQIPIRRP
jgi:malonyl-CoA O-methyltransferase